MGEIEPYAVLFGYFLETFIIGVFNIIKMMITNRYDGSGKAIFYFVPFFIFHFGMFVGVQSVFVFEIFSLDGSTLINEPFHLIENYQAILHLEGMNYVVYLLFFTQIMKFIFDFLLPKKYLEFTVLEIMFKPYVRVIIQQFTVLIALFFMMFGNVSIFAAVLLIIFRAIVDFAMISIRKNSKFLDYLVDKVDDDTTPKATIRKQLIAFSE